MANLISSTVRTAYTGVLNDLWETMTGVITVNKAPLEIINNEEIIETLPGYPNPTTSTSNITYLPVSQQFPAVILYNYKFSSVNQPQLLNKIGINSNNVVIKVREDARNYIKSGITENIIVDGNVYNVKDNETIQNYLGLKFYYFELEGTH